MPCVAQLPVGRDTGVTVFPAVVPYPSAAINPVALADRFAPHCIPIYPVPGTPSLVIPASKLPRLPVLCLSHEHAACHEAIVLSALIPLNPDHRVLPEDASP